ncbi:diphthine synthase [Candidatus Woesearchaeota archaeon CG_4_10_14_0_8_um_filter_47_5]|nr:MAG: diphthine synthase [Candidatus Woesearchaeota archaeon CG_4_10_14_0_8_um_filter_47_5]
MALYLIGLGLGDEKDITLKGAQAIMKCGLVFLESYTSLLSVPLEQLEAAFHKEIIPLARADLEENQESRILKPAMSQNVAVLVAGDPLCATTHIDLFLRAKKESIPVEIIHNASVISAIGITGLQVYKFGKTTSIPFPRSQGIASPYDTLSQNQEQGLHTLFLLDLDPTKGEFLTIPQAISSLFSIEKEKKKHVFTKKTTCLGCARLGAQDQRIMAGSAEALLKQDFGKPPFCLIVPGKLHFMEEEALALWRV